MEKFQLSRKNMAELLMSIKGEINKTPLSLLQQVWEQSHLQEVEAGKTLSAFIATDLPSIFEKIIKMKDEKTGFSINEIVSLGNQIQFTNLTPSAVQNWVKRDIKDFIGPPQLGKKYTVDQATILFIVEDLKHSLDFNSIRQILTLLFNNPADRTDDVISPLHLYLDYTNIFQELPIHNGIDKESQLKNEVESLERVVEQQAFLCAEKYNDLHQEQKEVVANVIIMASHAIVSTYFQYLSKRYLNATLFLQGLQS